MAMNAPLPPVSKSARAAWPSTNTESVNGRNPAAGENTIGRIARTRVPSGPPTAFALTVVGLTLQGLVVQDERGGKLDDDSLIEELTRMVTAYLTLGA
jgi:hypothetical protein